MKSKAHKHSPHREPEVPNMEVSGPQTFKNGNTSVVIDPIAAFPSTGQPVSDTMLKDMMLSLRASLHANLVTSIKSCQAEVKVLGAEQIMWNALWGITLYHEYFCRIPQCA